ncbi:hypothetical protein [Nocardiopsis sp. NRRL B-16309]|uniref:hypothetical protein n=1 Tax=Nocardiopsis sp. NRRL B-16309 TaxID=1519494 RepID=UPI0006AEF02F|nr:hypothetical protein [Nocardiopsis sp. NRRL B-16309]KOX11228.1 hypothetical protein ADL05_23550 [Nocardiopsis sp. NRRL B-16309]
MFPLHPHDPPSVGPYRLRARLGEDACARVYLGSAADRDPVAVRVVRPEYATDPDFRAAFAHLVQGANASGSAYVCRVRDADLRGAVPWAAVSRPLGPTLSGLIGAHGPLPADALHTLALALAQALADLHAARRVHGSLWPDGVLVTREGALLADAGLDRAAGGVEERAPHPSFAAPEGGASAATDVFSWAATLSQAAGGVEGPAGLPRVPLQLRGLVDTCLKRSPSLRPSAADLVRMLGGPVEPPPWPPAVPPAVEAVAAEQRRILESAATDGASTADGASDTDDASATEGEAGGRRSPRGTRGLRLLPLAAGGLALVLVAGAGAYWASARSGTDGSEEPAGPDGMITDAGCLEDRGYPVPDGEVDGAAAEASATAFSPDGDVLAVATDEYGLMVWDWRTGEEVARPAARTDALVPPVFAPIGCMVAAPAPVEYPGEEVPVQVAHTYDLPSGTTTEHLGPQRGPDTPEGGWSTEPRAVRGLAFSPDGSLLAIGLEGPLGAIEADNVGLLDTTGGGEEASITGSGAYGMAFPDDGRLVSATSDTVTVWDVGTGEELHRVRGTTRASFAAIPGTDEIVYAAGDRLVRWDYAEREPLGEFPMPELADAGPSTGVVAVDPGRSRLFVSARVVEDDEYVDASRVWDLDTGEEAVGGDGERVRFRHVSFHPDGEVLAMVTSEGRVVIADAETLEAGDPLF